jgi:hypothetical protein
MKYPTTKIVIVAAVGSLLATALATGDQPGTTPTQPGTGQRANADDGGIW